MDYRYKQLEQDLSALSNILSDLGSRLSEAAKDVTTSGVLPSEKLIEQILTARQSFETVRNSVHSQAGSMMVSPLPKADELASIHTISGLLKTAAAAEESKNSAAGEVEQATGLLSRVLGITHRETAAFQPLQECHAKVTELRNAISKATWPNRHPDAESVIGLKHPATVLLNFVENLDTLEDDKWIAFETTIAEAYGKPLFVAASRGRLVAQQQSAGKSPEPAKPAPVAEKPIEKKAAPEKLSDKTGVAPAIPVAPAASAPVERLVERQVERKEASAAPIHQTPPAVVAPIPVAPAAVAQAPTASTPTPAPPQLTPITSTTLPPRPPAPVSTPPTAVASAPPAPAVASSLSALANATEPAKPAVSEGTDKGRKEPRLAVPAAPQQPARTEPAAQQEQEPAAGDEASRAMAGDGSQRPQRWGFWRGNR